MRRLQKRPTTSKQTASWAEFLSTAQDIAHAMGPAFNANCDLRDRLGCESFAAELDGISANRARDLVFTDWAATGDPAMYRQLLRRGELAIRKLLSDAGMLAPDVERAIDEAFAGVVFGVASTVTP